MSHTQAIDKTAPLGTDAASGGAAELRNLKRDIEERMKLDHSWDGDLTNDGRHHRMTLAEKTQLTISSGVITNTQSYHSVDTEGDASTDDLATITAGTNVVSGTILVLQAENTGRVVTAKDGTGNLLLKGDYELDATDTMLTLIYDGSNWRELSRTASVVVPLAVPKGGTGVTTLTSGNVLVGAGASDITSTANISVAQGGTGVASLTANNLLLGAGASDVTFAAPGTSGNVLTSNGTVWASAAPAGGTSDLGICEGRLTLTSATPITTADVAGATSVYFTPYKGNRIALYDGSSDWNVRTFTQITIALGTLTDAKPYDLFAYDDGGTVTFDAPLVWTNDTTRATALALQDGVLVKTGATTRRYIGSFYTTAATTTEDSLASRLLYNYMNRVPRQLYRNDGGSHTYTTGTWRQFDSDTANQFAILQGWAEDVTSVEVGCHGRNSTAGAFGGVTLGLDSTSSPHTNATISQPQCDISNYILWMHSVLRVNVGVGWHKIVWLQRSQASGTYTYYSAAGAGAERGGMTGTCWA